MGRHWQTLEFIMRCSVIQGAKSDNLGICYCKFQIDISFSCVCPVNDKKFCHNDVKVVCGSTWVLSHGCYQWQNSKFSINNNYVTLLMWRHCSWFHGSYSFCQLMLHPMGLAWNTTASQTALQLEMTLWRLAEWWLKKELYCTVWDVNPVFYATKTSTWAWHT